MKRANGLPLDGHKHISDLFTDLLSPIGIGSLILAVIVLFPSTGMAKVRATQASNYRIVKGPKDPAIRGILREFDSLTRGVGSDTESRMKPITLQMAPERKSYRRQSRLQLLSQHQQESSAQPETPRFIENALYRLLKGEARPYSVVVTERRLRKPELTDLGIETLRNLPLSGDTRRKFGLKLASAFERSKSYKIYDGRHEGRFGFCDFMAIEDVKSRQVTLAGSCFSE